MRGPHIRCMPASQVWRKAPAQARTVKCRFCAIKKTHINSPFWLLRRLKLQLLYPNLLAPPVHPISTLLSVNYALSYQGHMPTFTEAVEEKTQIS